MANYVLYHLMPAEKDRVGRVTTPVRKLGGAKTIEDAKRNADKALKRNPEVNMVTIRTEDGEEVGRVERD